MHFPSNRNNFFLSLLKNSVRQVFCTFTKLHKMFTITCFLSFLIHVSSNPRQISRNLSLISLSKWYLSYFSLLTSLIPHQISRKKQRQSSLVREKSIVKIYLSTLVFFSLTIKHMLSLSKATTIMICFVYHWAHSPWPSLAISEHCHSTDDDDAGKK